jgi:hypothetical protein
MTSKCVLFTLGPETPTAEVASTQKEKQNDEYYQSVSSWGFGDFVFSWDYDFFADSSKARRNGFHEFVDTERMFLELFDTLRERKIIP